MTKVKIAFHVVVLSLFGASLYGVSLDDQECDVRKFPSAVFVYPQEGQQGRTLELTEKTLHDPKNLAPDAREWMARNWLQVVDQNHEKYSAFQIYKAIDGSACVLGVRDVTASLERNVDPEGLSVQSSGNTSTIAELSESPLKPSLVRRILNVTVNGSLRYGPLALFFVHPAVGLGASAAADIFGPAVSRKLSPRQSLSLEGEQSKDLSVPVQKSKKSKYDHDDEGSFAASFERFQNAIRE